MMREAVLDNPRNAENGGLGSTRAVWLRLRCCCMASLLHQDPGVEQLPSCAMVVLHYQNRYETKGGGGFLSVLQYLGLANAAISQGFQHWVAAGLT